MAEMSDVGGVVDWKASSQRTNRHRRLVELGEAPMAGAQNRSGNRRMAVDDQVIARRFAVSIIRGSQPMRLKRTAAP